jgi:hypothetical protein
MQATHIHLPSTSSPGAPSRGRRGLTLTTSSPEAAACYRDAMDRELGAEAGAAERLDEAIALDPAFAVAHAAKWMLARAGGDAHASRVARDSALALRDGLTGWERSHIACLAAMIERQAGAVAQAREHLSAHPGDLLLASQLVSELFFHGGNGKREAVMDLLRGLEPHNRGDWAFEVRLGFHTSELGDPRGALSVLGSALQTRPGSPFVAHAMAHALLECGEREASHRFLRQWVERHDPTGPLDGHIHWHLSLGEFESHQPAAALERYGRTTAPGVSHCASGLLLADAGGLLCRMLLDGVPIAGVAREPLLALLSRLDRSLDSPFVAVHVAALQAALGEQDALDRSVVAMERLPGASPSDAAYLVVKAFKAFAAGDMLACVEALERDRPRAWEAVGGSNEERSLIGTLYARASEHLVKP